MLDDHQHRRIKANKARHSNRHWPPCRQRHPTSKVTSPNDREYSRTSDHDLIIFHPPTDITRSQEEGITRQVAAQLVHLGLSRAEQSPLPRTDEWISMLDEHARKYLTANVYDPSDPFSKPPAESGPRE
jgi:hypothetical protein